MQIEIDQKCEICGATLFSNEKLAIKDKNKTYNVCKLCGQEWSHLQ